MSSSILWRCLRERRRFCRLFFSISCCFSDLRLCSLSSSVSARARRASHLLSSRERDSPKRIWTPLGRCLRRTTLEVLLVFCPPGPPPRMNVSSSSHSDTAASASSSRMRAIVAGASTGAFFRRLRRSVPQEWPDLSFAAGRETVRCVR